jgi:CDP-diacylglycerol--glycerol-3-phosphate 3-phosphatidyltransferase
VASDFGALIDPFADKLLVLSSLAALAAVGVVPAWLVGLIAAREAGVTLMRAHARRSGVVIAAGPLGKLKMCVQSCVLIAVLALDLSAPTLDVLLYAMAAITLLSGVEIAMRARRRAVPVAAAAGTV